MKKILGLILLAFFCLGTNFAWADDVDDEEFQKPGHDIGNENSVPNDARMGTPQFSGPGCPNGSVDVALSHDKKSISILFDEFGLTLDLDEKNNRLRSSCSIVLPFTVPKGMTVSVVRLDYRGYGYIEASPSIIALRSQYYISGLKNNGKMTKVGRQRAQFTGPMDEEFILSSRIRNKKHRGSHCGKDIEFHINNELVVRRKKSEGEVEAFIDSIDGSAESGAVYYLNWERCEDKPGKVKDRPKRPDRPKKPARPNRPKR